MGQKNIQDIKISLHVRYLFLPDGIRVRFARDGAAEINSIAEGEVSMSSRFLATVLHNLEAMSADAAYLTYVLVTASSLRRIYQPKLDELLLGRLSLSIWSLIIRESHDPVSSQSTASPSTASCLHDVFGCIMSPSILEDSLGQRGVFSPTPKIGFSNKYCIFHVRDDICRRKWQWRETRIPCHGKIGFLQEIENDGKNSVE